MSNDAIMALNLPTGIPFVYELDENMKPVKPMQVNKPMIIAMWFMLSSNSPKFISDNDTYIHSLFQFLGDEETVAKAMAAVAAQGKAK